VSRHRDEPFDSKSVPHEDSRLRVPHISLEAAIESIRTHIQDAFAELVLNLGEVGMNEWEDRVARKVIINGSCPAGAVSSAELCPVYVT
jgi:hypothetical protein